jgi:hypothetical protein
MELEETGDISNIHSPPEEQLEVDEEISVAPHIIDDGLPDNPRPQRTRRAPCRLRLTFIKQTKIGINWLIFVLTWI